MAWAFLDHPVPFGIAHQGGTDVAAGNTIPAFEHAVSLGYAYIETDVQATSDGVLAMFHDDELGPKTGADGRVADKTWAELSELQVDGQYAIPRLDEVVERFPETRFNIDPKSDEAVQPLVDLIRETSIADRICIGSFSDARLSRVRDGLGPKQCMSPGPRGMVKILLRALLGLRRPSSFAAVQIPSSYKGIPLTPRWLIDRFHRQGLQVHIWTINDEAEMRSLLDKGVDAIITDEVGLLRQVLDSRS